MLTEEQNKQRSKPMKSEEETLLKVLQNIKDKYYSKSETYFDEVLEQLKKAEVINEK